METTILQARLGNVNLFLRADNHERILGGKMFESPEIYGKQEGSQVGASTSTRMLWDEAQESSWYSPPKLGNSWASLFLHRNQTGTQIPKKRRLC